MPREAKPREHKLAQAAAPSKLNTALDVPATLATVRPTVPLTPAPRVPTHSADVAEAHAVVLQSASPSTDVAVASLGPKSMPDRVTLATTEATLYGDAIVRTGPEAAQHGVRSQAINVRPSHRQSRPLQHATENNSPYRQS